MFSILNFYISTAITVEENLEFLLEIETTIVTLFLSLDISSGTTKTHLFEQSYGQPK